MYMYLEIMCVPESYSLIPGAGCYETAIRRELARSHHTCMTLKRGHLCVCVRVRACVCVCEFTCNIQHMNSMLYIYAAELYCILAVVPPAVHTRAVSSEEHVTT